MKKQLPLMFAVLVISGSAGWAGVKTSYEPGRVQWDVPGEYDGAVLTVSLPNGEVVRRELDAKEMPVFELPSGAEDGEYMFELRLPGSPVVSGGFQVRDGAILAPGGKDSMRRITADDQVILDDLIVKGNGCIGIDCVNNESFGTDTLRLKTTAIRIKFEDTSSSAGFPSNDWQLTANDSETGGANKFSIEDITNARVPFTIAAGATTNSIYVGSTGKVGFRTTTPALDLHINTSDTPAIRLEQNVSGGLAAQVWDIAADESEFFIRDVTGGSRLPFRIRPGAPTDSMHISASGRIGVGTASPAEKVELEENVDAGTVVQVENTNPGSSASSALKLLNNNGHATLLSKHGSGRVAIRFGQTLGDRSELLHAGGNGLLIGTLEDDSIVFGTNNIARMTVNGLSGLVTVNNGLTVNGTFTNNSSRTFKESFQPVNSNAVLQKFVQLPIQEWSYKDDERKLRHIGPTVEDFHSAFGLGTDGKYIVPMDVQGITMLAVQGLYQLVIEKDAEIAELRKRLDKLESDRP